MRIASNPRFSTFSIPKRDSQERGLSSGTLRRFARVCESILFRSGPSEGRFARSCGWFPCDRSQEPSKTFSAKLVQMNFQFGVDVLMWILVAHDCGCPCRATRVAADFLDFIAFCRCSTGVALHPLKILVSHLPPPLSREVSHRNLGLKRCRATRGCRSCSCGCRATLWMFWCGLSSSDRSLQILTT